MRRAVPLRQYVSKVISASTDRPPRYPASNLIGCTLQRWYGGHAGSGNLAIRLRVGFEVPVWIEEVIVCIASEKGFSLLRKRGSRARNLHYGIHRIRRLSAIDAISGDAATLYESDGAIGVSGLVRVSPPQRLWSQEIVIEFLIGGGNEWAQIEWIELVGDRTFEDGVSSSRSMTQPCGTKTLYHQTDEASARSILSDGSFRCGSTGWAGGASYFAGTPAGTGGKAQRKGVILSATVDLGIAMVLDPRGSHHGMCLARLPDGCKSVMIPAERTGVEYAVYSSSQVSNIQRHSTVD